jgi:hypothetical protein
MLAIYDKLLARGGGHVQAFFQTVGKIETITNKTIPDALKRKVHRGSIDRYLQNVGRAKSPPNFISTPDGNVDVGSAIQRIRAEVPDPHPNDGSIFKNRPNQNGQIQLPINPKGTTGSMWLELLASLMRAKGELLKA